MTQRGFCCLGFDSKHDDIELTFDGVRRERRNNLTEMLDWTGDLQPDCGASRCMGMIKIDHGDRQASARPIGPERAADSARSPDQNGRMGHQASPNSYKS